MKTLAFAILAALLVGCAKQSPVQPPTQVAQAISLYGAVKPSMQRERIYQLVGKPQKTSSDGCEEWRTQEGSQIAVLSLKFGPDGKVIKHDFHIDDAGQFTPVPQ